MKKLQCLVFCYTFSLVSSKMLFQDFETGARYPLPHSKQFSLTHKKYSQSQNYAFSTQSKATSSVLQTETQTSKTDSKITEQIDSFDATSVQEAVTTSNKNTQDKYPSPSSANNLAHNTETTKNDSKECDKTTNAKIEHSENTDTIEKSLNQQTEPMRTAELNKKQPVVTISSDEAVENTIEATPTTKEFQETEKEIIENAHKKNTQFDSANTLTQSEIAKSLTQAGSTQSQKVATTDTANKNLLSVAQASEKEATSRETKTGNEKANSLTVTQASGTSAQREITTDIKKSNQFKNSDGKLSTQKLANTGSNKNDELTVTQANGANTQKITTSNGEKLIQPATTKNSDGKLSVIKLANTGSYQNNELIVSQKSGANTQKVSTFNNKNPNQFDSQYSNNNMQDSENTNSKTQVSDTNAQRITNIGSEKSELTVTQASSTSAQKVFNQDYEQVTTKGHVPKPAKEATFTNNIKHHEQKAYASANPDTKSVFLKREDILHKKGRYDLSQMDRVKAIQNAIQMDLNFKILMMEDGTVPGKCFCCCEMNSRPIFIELDSEPSS